MEKLLPAALTAATDGYVKPALEALGKDPTQFELALARIQQDQPPAESMIAPFNASL